MLNRERIILYLQWFILLAFFSYDGFTYLPEEKDFALLKSLYYVTIFLSFLFITTLQMQAGKVEHRKIGSISYFIQIFLWLYFVRIYYDFMIAGVSQSVVTNPFAAVFLYLNAAIVPFYGFYFFRWELVNLRKLNTAILLILLAMGLSSMYAILTGKALEYLGPDGRFMGNESMDTIAFGHLGTSITMLAIALFYQRDIRWWHKLLSTAAILVGLFISVAAGSRGALVALIICFLAYLYMNGHKLKVLIGLPILAAIVIVVLPYLNELLMSYDNMALERLYNSIYAPEMLDAGVSSGRDVIYEKAITNIENHPLLGSSVFIDGEYVHNSILEAFLGLGVFGGILFVGILAYALFTAFRLGEKNKQYLFASLLFIQYMIYGFFSRTLSMLPVFWTTLYLVISLKAFDDESIDHNTVL